MTEPTGKKPKQINIEVSKDLEPIYANFAKVKTRVVMTPFNAKLLHRALAENLRKFEAK